MRQVKLCFIMVIVMRGIASMENTDRMAKNMEQHAFNDNTLKEDQDVSCECHNSTEVYSIETECKCLDVIGANLKIPEVWVESLNRLTLTDSELTYIDKDLFQPFRLTLEDV